MLPVELFYTIQFNGINGTFENTPGPRTHGDSYCRFQPSRLKSNIMQSHQLVRVGPHHDVVNL
jgi:hypothetical protein